MLQSAPSISQLRTWLADWELRKPLRVRLLNGGFTSHVWKVDSGDSSYVAKLAYQPVRDVENGLLAAATLARHGLQTGPAVRTRSGRMTKLVEYPAGRWHALAMLRFVDGEQLDWRAPGALRIVGNTLGVIHRVLFEDTSLELEDQILTYLTDETARACQPEIETLIARAVAAARSFEAKCPVTYGPIYGDRLQVHVNGRDGPIGVIDWGTVSRGPLLFDLAIAAHVAQREGNVDLTDLWTSYLLVSPIHSVELDGLRYYEALMWARSAKYFGYRMNHNVSLGDARPGANIDSFVRAITALERLLDE
jgi:Ser/Thr protein kinase RdoA (MazF antagonist)